jgi:hypothetical protein
MRASASLDRAAGLTRTARGRIAPAWLETRGSRVQGFFFARMANTTTKTTSTEIRMESIE